MPDHTVCPRCGARDSFMKGYLPETCVCRICQSQLDWREIPGCGPDCGPRKDTPEDQRKSATDEGKGGAEPGGGGGEPPEALPSDDRRWDV